LSQGYGNVYLLRRSRFAKLDTGRLLYFIVRLSIEESWTADEELIKLGRSWIWSKSRNIAQLLQKNFSRMHPLWKKDCV